MIRRNLAIYKLSGKPWTEKEIEKVYNYVGITETCNHSELLKNKYIWMMVPSQ